MPDIQVAVDKVDDTTETALQNATPAGTPPRRRLATPAAAFKIFDNLKTNYQPVAVNRARLQGMYDGNAPYDAAELTRLGQSYRCNVNFREMESIIDTNVSAAWALHMDVGTLIESKLSTKYLPYRADGRANDWEGIIDAEYTRTLLKWPGFYSNLDLALHECMLFGLGIVAWPNKWDWRSKAFKTGNVLIPPLTPTDIDMVELMFIRDRKQLCALYAEIENRGMANKKGWNTEAIKRLLIKKYVAGGETKTDTQDTTQTSVWESLQQRIKVGDPSIADKDFEEVEVVHVLIREVAEEGKISHYIIAEDMEFKDAWLYKDEDAYTSMSNAVWCLPYSYGDGYLRSSKGLGHRSFPHCEFSNRFLCTTFDGATLAASLLVQPKTGLDTARLNLLRVGPVTLVPESLSIVQTSFMPQVSSLVQLRGLSKDILNNNTGVYRARAEVLDERTQPKTARQVMSEENREARFERNQIEHFYVHWQLWHAETFRRLTNKEYLRHSVPLPGQKEAREFIKRCVDQGVPEEILTNPNAIDIRVSRAIGMGSPTVKMDITNQMQQMKGSMDEQGRKQADREWGAVRVGYWNVDKFFPKSTRDNTPSNASSIAVLENYSFAEGKDVPVGSDQPQIMHISIHFARMEEMAKAFQAQQIDPIPAVKELTISLQHTAQHIAYLALDPTRGEQVKRVQQIAAHYNDLFVALQKMAKKQLDEQVAQQQAQAQAAQDQEEQDAQQGPPMDKETQIEMAKIQKDLAIEKMKQDSLNQVRYMKAAEGIQIKQQQAAANTQLKAAQVNEDIDHKRRLLESELELKARQAAVQ